MVIYHNCHIYGIWMSKEVGELCFKVFIWNGKASQKSENQFLWEMGFSLCNTAITNFMVLLVTVKGFIRYHFLLYYCCFSCFISIGIWKVNSLDWGLTLYSRKICKTRDAIKNDLKLQVYSVCTAIYAFTHPCDTNTFIHSLTRMHLFQLKILIWIEFI